MAGVGTLESDSEERVLVDGGRRHSDSRGAAAEDGGRRTSPWLINGRHHNRSGQSRERGSEDRKKIREDDDHCCSVSTERVSEDVGFSCSDSRRVSENHRRSGFRGRVRGDGGHGHSSSWERVRGDRGFRSSSVSLSEVSGHQTSDSVETVGEDRSLRLSGTWEGVRAVRGPGPSRSGERSSDGRSCCFSGSWEGGSSLSSSWEGGSEDGGYAASDSSGVSVSPESSRRLSGLWERDSEDRGSGCRGSWERAREDGGPGPSEDEDGCCSGSWATAGEDRRRSRGLDSTLLRSRRDRTMPGVSHSGPSTSFTETATPGESDYFHGPCLCHTPFLTTVHISLSPFWQFPVSAPN